MDNKFKIGDNVKLSQNHQTTDFVIERAVIISLDDKSAIIKDVENEKTLSAPLSYLSVLEKFNFYNFLEQQGYEKETIRNADGTTFCTNYQKELDENIWNCLTAHSDMTITGASPKSGLVFKQRPQPASAEEAVDLLKLIEELPDEKPDEDTPRGEFFPRR